MQEVLKCTAGHYSRGIRGLGVGEGGGGGGGGVEEGGWFYNQVFFGSTFYASE